MSERIELTEEQKGFIIRSIPEFSEKYWNVTIAGAAGSDRKFYRVLIDRGEGTYSVILIVWSSEDEDWDRCFGIFKTVSGLVDFLPEIYAADENLGLILVEDCGYLTLEDYLKKNINSVFSTYKNVLDSLIKWHEIDAPEDSVINSRILDRNNFLWETDYFSRHCVSEYFRLDSMLDSDWENERKKLADEVSGLPLVCIHRDFQSENIIVNKKRIRFLDYQGARLGPAEYDVASLLYDPYVSVLSEKNRYDLIDYYNKKRIDSITRRTFHVAALQRLCQALGAYGNLSLNKGKRRYLRYIPIGLSNIRYILEMEADYPCLKNIVSECLKRL